MDTERRPRWRAVNGILLLDKPIGLSSNQALQKVRRAFQAAKAGHTGTLDVAASGLLPICFGAATKVCSFLLDADKRYRAEIRFGQTTTTGDREGDVIATAPAVPSTAEEVEAALRGFHGEIQQTPPMYSALKHRGQPLYKLARQGIEIERAARTVQIHHLELLHYTAGLAVIDVSCSKGTYIRTLAVALGEVLGCGAHLAGLHRLATGPFNVTAAHPLSLFTTTNYELGDYDALLLAPDQALSGYSEVTIDAAGVQRVAHGQAIHVAAQVREPLVVRIYGPAKQFIGMGVLASDGTLTPKRLMGDK
ncbi:MAG: tRNA pseudouridine(55) synthase TruB [Gammaproteobacteria bacterium]|nr:tRNA pseudouridine(55) synthase TruB [Gammaproteobacteria bacterium]